MPKLYDLSPAIRPALPVWPGDTPYSSKLTCSLGSGDSINLSSFTATPHLGSHADSPFHTEPDGAGIDTLDLDAFWGLCRVVKVPAEALISVQHVTDALERVGGGVGDPPRLLLATGSVGDRSKFPEEFSALSPELARWLGETGYRLVGLDTPSVDPFTSTALEAHHALVAGGVVNLEGLVLDGVPDGVYELAALPLKLEGLDASPVRAVLREV
jgi:arylformamidase